MSKRHGSRLPKWNKWKLIPEVKLWQAIALSLEIEPDRVDVPDGSIYDTREFGESEAFKDRLEILRSNVGRASELTATAITPGSPFCTKIPLAGFARWAQSVAWVVPAELIDIGRISANDGDKPVQDWLKWTIERDLWTLQEAAHLLLDLEPPSTDEIPSSSSPQGRLYHRLKDAVIMRDASETGLYAFESPTGKIGHRRVRVADCVAWALDKLIPIPPPLALLGRLEQGSISHTEDPVDERERTAYLNTIGALLRLLLEKGLSGKSPFPSQSKIIDTIEVNHPQKYGLKRRTLENNFAAAKRSIASD
jgi:hypothetical protein